MGQGLIRSLWAKGKSCGVIVVYALWSSGLRGLSFLRQALQGCSVLRGSRVNPGGSIFRALIAITRHYRKRRAFMH